MNAEGAARRWIEGWAQAWPARDADGVAALYAEDAAFRSAPFRALQPPREYAAAAFEDEEDVDCRFGEPFVAGDRAAVEYWATLREAGSDVTIAGVALIRFDADGQVVDQRDYWHLEEGRREPRRAGGTSAAFVAAVRARLAAAADSAKAPAMQAYMKSEMPGASRGSGSYVRRWV